MQFHHPLRPVALLAVVLNGPQAFLLEVEPIATHRLRWSSLLDVVAEVTCTVLLFVGAGAQLMYTPLLDDVLRSVEELHHINVVI